MRRKDCPKPQQIPRICRAYAKSTESRIARGMVGAKGMVASSLEYDLGIGRAKLSDKFFDLTKTPSVALRHNEKTFLFPINEADAMNLVLEYFRAIPDEYIESLLSDFRTAVESNDFENLLIVMSDWSATGELYNTPGAFDALTKAIDGRKGIGDWLNGNL